MAINKFHTNDPIQGFDVSVFTSPAGVSKDTGAAAGTTFGTGLLVGSFTSLMFKIVSQTETYLVLNERLPRMLDGEVIVVWSLEQGMINPQVITNTFGSSFATQFAQGRGKLIPRSKRFDIHFQVSMAVDDATAAQGQEGGTEETFRTNGANPVKDQQYILKYCRVDTMSFGVAAGRHIVANSWQGTAQYVAAKDGQSPA